MFLLKVLLIFSFFKNKIQFVTLAAVKLMRSMCNTALASPKGKVVEFRVRCVLPSSFTNFSHREVRLGMDWNPRKTSYFCKTFCRVPSAYHARAPFMILFFEKVIFLNKLLFCMQLWGAHKLARTSNIVCARANNDKFSPKNILSRAKSCASIYAKKLTLDSLRKNPFC